MALIVHVLLLKVIVVNIVLPLIKLHVLLLKVIIVNITLHTI